MTPHREGTSISACPMSARRTTRMWRPAGTDSRPSPRRHRRSALGASPSLRRTSIPAMPASAAAAPRSISAAHGARSLHLASRHGGRTDLSRRVPGSGRPHRQADPGRRSNLLGHRSAWRAAFDRRFQSARQRRRGRGHRRRPATILAAVMPAPEGVSELALAGLLGGQAARACALPDDPAACAGQRGNRARRHRFAHRNRARRPVRRPHRLLQSARAVPGLPP